MKTILTAGIAGVLLFAMSASVSWYLMNQNQPEEPEVVELDEETQAGVPPIGPSANKSEQMPVAMRPNVPLTVESVLELSESIRRKERELIGREKRAQKTEQNIQLLFEDLKIERAELAAMADAIESKLRSAQGAVAELKQENQVLTTQTQELTQLTKKQEKKKDKGSDVLDEIGERVKTAQPWFEGLDDEQAANYLKEFANNGDLEFAARLLKSLKQRKASKILAAFNDPDFVQQILAALSSNEGEKDRSEDGGVARRRKAGTLR